MSESDPHSIDPAFPISGINNSVVIYKGPLEFSGVTPAPMTGDGSVTWEWQPTTGPRFEATVDDVSALFQAESVEVGVPGQAAVESFVSNAEGLEHGSVAGHLGDFKIDPDEPVDNIVFHLPNFVNYRGGIIKDDVDSGVRSRRGRLTFDVDNWRIQIDSLPSTKNTIKKLSREGGFGITHIGQISHLYGQEVTLNQVQGLRKSLGFFLSFARGLWTQPVLLKGFQQAESGKRQQNPMGFGPTAAAKVRLDSWASTQTWFSKFMANEMPSLFRKFWQKWSNASSQEVLRQGIGWYLEANGGAAALQSRLILAQVALEMMAYEVLTDASGNEPRGSAAPIITDMLAKYKILVAIPSEMPELKALASSATLKDNPSDPDLTGPGVMVAIRNALVHSKRAKRQKRGALTTAHYVEAWQLALWYLELVLLAWIGYDQKYSCRWKDGREGDLDLVPWAVPPATGSRTGIPTAS